MGADISAEVNEAKDICGKFVVCFGAQYTKMYLVALMKMAKKDIAKQANGAVWVLLKCDKAPPPQVIKTGVLNKLSKYLKKWNSRYVIVRGDYLIDYYESEAKFKAGGKPLGTINMSNKNLHRDANDTVLNRLIALAEKCKINIEEMPKPDKYPDHTMEIYHEQKGPIYLEVTQGEEEWKEWCTVLEKCRYFAPRLNEYKDKAHMFAFPMALWRTRWECDMWGWWWGGGGEESQLVDAINQKIADVVLYKLDCKLTMPWGVRSKIRNQFLKTVDGFVSTAVSPAWKAAYEGVKKVRPTVETKVREGMQPIVDAQLGIQKSICEKVEASSKDFIAEKILPHLGPLLDVVFSPVMDAFRCILRAFDVAIEKGREHYKSQEDRLYMVWHHNYNSDFWEAERKIWDLYDPLWALRLVFEDVYPWSITSRAQRRLRKTLDNALFTFENILEDGKATGKSWDEAAMEAKQRLAVDCRTAIMRVLGRILFGVVENFFEKLVIRPARKLIAPLADMVPQAIKDFVDPEDLLEELLYSILKNVCNNVFSPYASRIDLGVPMDSVATAIVVAPATQQQEQQPAAHKNDDEEAARRKKQHEEEEEARRVAAEAAAAAELLAQQEREAARRRDEEADAARRSAAEAEAHRLAAEEAHRIEAEAAAQRERDVEMEARRLADEEAAAARRSEQEAEEHRRAQDNARKEEEAKKEEEERARELARREAQLADELRREQEESEVRRLAEEEAARLADIERIAAERAAEEGAAARAAEHAAEEHRRLAEEARRLEAEADGERDREVQIEAHRIAEEETAAAKASDKEAVEHHEKSEEAREDQADAFTARIVEEVIAEEASSEVLEARRREISLHVDPNRDAADCDDEKGIELVYFDFGGRAQATRLVFSIGGVPFKDTRLSFPQFGALNASGELPLQSVPILKVDGSIVACQSGAILRFAAELTELNLTNPMDILRGEDAAGTAQDLFDLCVKWFVAGDDEKNALAAELVESGFPFFAKHLESILSSSPSSSGPFVTESLSFADVLIYDACHNVFSIAKSINAGVAFYKFPKLMTLLRAVAQIPAVAEQQPLPQHVQEEEGPRDELEDLKDRIRTDIAAPVDAERLEEQRDAVDAVASTPAVTLGNNSDYSTTDNSGNNKNIDTTNKDIELIYFQAKGRAHAIRLTLAIGGIPFQDTRLSYEGFHQLVASGALPLDTVPVLKMDGEVVATQSIAILRLAGQLADLTLDTPLDVLRGEDVVGTMEDIFGLRVQWFRASAEDKEGLAKEICESGFPFYAKHVESVLSDAEYASQGPYVTNSLSYADVYTYCVCSYITEIAQSIGAADPVRCFPKLSELVEAVHSNSMVQSIE